MQSRAPVSVVVAAYNAADSIQKALTSVLNQTAPPFEIIVVDDASSDGTADLVGALAREHPIVRVISLETNLGPAGARNAGFASAQGDWIAVLDADDAFTTDRLARLVEAAKASNADIVADNLILYDAVAGADVGLAVPTAEGRRDIDAYDYLENAQTGGSQLDWGVLKPMFRREFLAREAIRYSEHLRHGEDFDFVLQALLAGARFVFIPEGGYVYTERWGSISRMHSGLSRTTVDYSGLVADTDRLLATSRVTADPRLRDLLRRRRRGLAALNARYRTRRAIGRRDLPELARLVVSTPGAIGALATVMAEKALSILKPPQGGDQ